MPFISINVTGLTNIIDSLNNITNEMRTTRQRALKDTSDFMVQELKKNAHVITGKMKGSVRSQPVTDMQYLVEVGVPYAFFENKRGGFKVGSGPHNFADRAELATRDRFSSIVASAYGNMFSQL